MSKISMEEGYREYLEDQAKKYENLKNKIRTETTGSLRSVITGIKSRYDSIDELNIIEGYDIIYSGTYFGFMEQCTDIMVSHRDELLERGVVAHKIITKGDYNRLFVFLL